MPAYIYKHVHYYGKVIVELKNTNMEFNCVYGTCTLLRILHLYFDQVAL